MKNMFGFMTIKVWVLSIQKSGPVLVVPLFHHISVTNYPKAITRNLFVSANTLLHMEKTFVEDTVFYPEIKYLTYDLSVIELFTLSVFLFTQVLTIKPFRATIQKPLITTILWYCFSRCTNSLNL